MFFFEVIEQSNQMELKELTEKTLALFGCGSVEELGGAIMECVARNDTCLMKSFAELVGGDLSKDWLQMIYQYYCADRKDKGQDYTPKCLALFLSRLVGDSAETVDLCAGSGALTIQRWKENPDTVFILYEIDSTVIPYLLFNMAIRNITATVRQGDVLQQEVVREWHIRKGVEFGKITYFKPAV
jgi:Type I restriction-modification system methyltransferase subunit